MSVMYIHPKHKGKLKNRSKRTVNDIRNEFKNSIGRHVIIDNYVERRSARKKGEIEAEIISASRDVFTIKKPSGSKEAYSYIDVFVGRSTGEQTFQIV